MPCNNSNNNNITINNNNSYNNNIRLQDETIRYQKALTT